jgi:hypothetical protein
LTPTSPNGRISISEFKFEIQIHLIVRSFKLFFASDVYVTYLKITMEECTNGTLIVRTGCILTYQGSQRDIVLNYALLVANVLVCSITTASNAHYGASRGLERKLVASGALVFVAAYQINLCLLVGCSGISIIWSACAGWIFSEGRRRACMLGDSGTSATEASSSPWNRHITLLVWERFMLAFDILVIIYYACVTEPITTVAHLCAILMGFLLSLASIRMFDPQYFDRGSQNQLSYQTFPTSETIED